MRLAEALITLGVVAAREGDLSRLFSTTLGQGPSS
jgi:hypothetical protein